MESIIQRAKMLINPAFNYTVKDNVFHFILNEADRPSTPKYLSEEMYKLFPDTLNFVSDKKKINLSRLNNNEHYDSTTTG